MDIFRTDLNKAIEQGELQEKNFLVQENGAIRPLGPLSRHIWQNFGQYTWVRKTLFGVDHENLAKLLLDTKQPTEAMTNNINFLRENGQLTSEHQQNIQMKVNQVSKRNLPEEQ